MDYAQVPSLKGPGNTCLEISQRYQRAQIDAELHERLRDLDTDTH